MAQATVTLTFDDPLTGFDKDQHSTWIYGTVAVNAGTYATGGIGTLVSGPPINWVVGDFPKVANLTPRDVTFYSVKPTGTTIGGFSYLWHRANNSFIVMSGVTLGTSGQSPAQTEFNNGVALPTNVTSDIIRFSARFSSSMSGF